MSETGLRQQSRISSCSGSTDSTAPGGRASTDSSSTGGFNVQHASHVTLTHFPRPPSAPTLNALHKSHVDPPVSPLDTAYSEFASPVSPVDEAPVATPIWEQPPSPYLPARENAASEKVSGDTVNATPEEAKVVTSQHTRTDTDVTLVDEKRKAGLISSVRQFSRASSIGRDLGFAPPEDVPEWQPTLLRVAPLIGIAALLLVLCCMLASLGILIGSNGEQVAKWPWSPSVYLAISSAIISRSLQFALLQAIPLAWWYRAYRGSTMIGLQRHWESGQGICRALYNAKYEPILAFAMLASTLVIADGPFLQKASSVESELQTSSVMLNLAIAPELPTGFGGNFSKNGVATGEAITPALDGFTYNSTLVANITGCDGLCNATVRGPGVTIRNCSSQTWPLNRHDLTQNSSATWGSGLSGKVAPMPLFNIVVRNVLLADPPFSGPEEVELQIGIANFTDCNGHYTETTCKLVSAVLEYEVQVHRTNIIKFAHPPSEARLVALANNTYINASDEEVPLTIIALGYFLKGQIAANATMRPVSDPRQTGSAIMPDANTFNNIVTRFTIESSLCNSAFADPTMTVLNYFNELLFRAGIAAANDTSRKDGLSTKVDPGLTLGQDNVPASQTIRINVFRSDLRWWSGAAILELFAVLAILPVFWGYWRLGLKVSLSPLEVANVFQAPLLGNVNSGSGARGVVEKMRDVEVRCGVEETGRGPVEGSSADEDVNRRERCRLTLGEASVVTRPRTGTRFC